MTSHALPIAALPGFLLDGDAACDGMGDLFYPDSESPDDPRVRAAKAVCAGCRLRRKCLEHAIDRHEFGIWGGTTFRERTQLAKKRAGGWPAARGR